MIASSGTITLSPASAQILAQGGQGGTASFPGETAGGGGSGGAVRLIANTVTGTGGTINIAGGLGGSGVGGVSGGTGSVGRVRVEAFTNSLAVNLGTSSLGVLSSGAPTSVVLPNAPSLKIASVGGVAAPAAPTGSFVVADVVLPATTTNPVAVGLQAANIPLGTTIAVRAGRTHTDPDEDPTNAATTMRSTTAAATTR